MLINILKINLYFGLFGRDLKLTQNRLAEAV